MALVLTKERKMMEYTIRTILDVLLPLGILTIIGFLANYIRLRKKMGVTEAFNASVGAVDTIASNVVLAMMQTKVNGLKEAGKFTPEVAESIRNEARDIIVDLTPTAVMKDLAKSDVNEINLVDSLIESNVVKAKNNKNHQNNV